MVCRLIEKVHRAIDSITSYRHICLLWLDACRDGIINVRVTQRSTALSTCSSTICAFIGNIFRPLKHQGLLVHLKEVRRVAMEMTILQICCVMNASLCNFAGLRHPTGIPRRSTVRRPETTDRDRSGPGSPPACPSTGRSYLCPRHRKWTDRASRLGTGHGQSVS